MIACCCWSSLTRPYKNGVMSSSHPIVCPGHTRAIRDLRFSNPTEDGIFLISGTHDGQPMIRSAETGDWIGTFEGHKGACWSATLNFDATKALTAAADNSMRYWDALTGECTKVFEHGHIVVKCCDLNSVLAFPSLSRLTRPFD